MFKILVSENTNPVYQSVVSMLRGKGYLLEQIELSQMHGNEETPAEHLLAQVLESTSEAHPDLVLLTSDASENAPENYGFKFCKHLKNNPQTESIPVVFLSCVEKNGKSAGANARHTVEGFECGANDVIHTPAMSGPEQEYELLARIQAAIRTKMHLNKTKALADQLNQMNNELYERNLAVEKELYTTRQLQQSLLPPYLPDEPVPEKAAPQRPPAQNTQDDADRQVAELAESVAQMKFSKCHFRNEHLKITGVYLPCDALGGDLYDVIQFGDQSIGVSIADVSGHGVPAAFITAIFKASFYRTTHNFTLPGDVLYNLNNELINIIKTGQYVTTVYSRLSEDTENPGQYKMQFSGAGHPYPFYYRAETGSIERLQENGTPLAWFKSMDYPMGEITLKKGDKVLMFSDGISEMKNTENDMYGEEALGAVFQRLVNALEEGSLSGNMLDHLLQELSDFTQGHPLDDDVSVVLIEAV